MLAPVRIHAHRADHGVLAEDHLVDVDDEQVQVIEAAADEGFQLHLRGFDCGPAHAGLTHSIRLYSISSTMGSSSCPFFAKNVVSSCSLTFPCLPIVRYSFFTAVLLSRFRTPILRNQAEPPLNFQLWLGHPYVRKVGGWQPNQFLIGCPALSENCPINNKNKSMIVPNNKKPKVIR